METLMTADGRERKKVERDMDHGKMRPISRTSLSNDVNLKTWNTIVEMATNLNEPLH